MKTLLLFISVLLTTNLLAGDIPFVFVKQDQCSKENFLNVELKDTKKELTAPGKKIKPVQDLSYSCFKDNVDIDNLIKKMKAIYPINEDEVKKNYSKWEKIKKDSNYIDEQTYYKDDPEYFKNKTVEKYEWIWDNYFCGKDPKDPNKKETIE
ncbi:MAG TPA: hypothetical protein PK443_00830 [bacterium]|nr:hypothetical protein [bacterium]